MPSYTLELELFSSYVTDVPEFEIWADGILLGGTTYSVTSGGFSISVNPSYGGSLPTSLEFRFNDVSVEVPRSIEIRSVKINDKYVNTGNYLSSSSLVNGGNSTVDIDSVNTNDSDFIFDASDPATSEFTTGATETFTAGNDTYRRYNDSDDEVFDMLAGRDVAYLGSGNDKVSGGAGDDIIYGRAGADLLYGGADNDRIYGGDDNDTIYGGTGNDRLHGEGGDDEIHGGAGDDRLNGHDGNDVITGGAGEDKINGGSGINFLYGGGDDDQIVGGANDDTIDGGDGNDLAYGGSGADHIDGGDGDDILVGGAGDDVINGGDNDDTMYGQQDNDELYGGNGNDYILGGDGTDTIDGGADDDTIFGGLDDDVITGGSGNDILVGGGTVVVDPNNLTSYDPSQDGGGTLTQTTGGFELDSNNWKKLLVNYTVTANTMLEFNFRSTIEAEVTGIGFDDDNSISNTTTFELYGTQTWGIQAFANYDGSGDWTHYKINVGAFYTGTFQYLIFANDDDGNSPANGTNGNSFWSGITIYESTLADDIDDIDGGAGDDYLVGNMGADILDGGAGNDNLNGNDGDDVLNGGTNNDMLHGGDGADTLNGGANNDEIYGNDGDDIIILDAGNDIINGGAGTDVIDASGHTAYVTIDLSNLAAQSTRLGTDTISNIENLIGSDFNDNLRGDANVNVIDGGIGNDTIYGYGGADILDGGAGNDDFWYAGTEAYGDVIDGGADFDEIQLSAATFWNAAVSFTSIERLDMNGFDITADLNDGFDFTGLTVTARGDFFGQGGNENMTGSDSVDYIYGLVGNDVINGGLGNDFLYGGDDVDTISGGIGNDRLYGEAGDDILNGDAGTDLIYGGAGADVMNGGDDNDDFYLSGSEGVGDTITGDAGYDEVLLETDIFLDLTTTFITMERVVFGGFNITANLGTGFDLTGMVRNGAGNLLGQGGVETISGTESDDNIYGLAGADILNGNGGNDNFYVSGTESLGDQYDGGTGGDDEIILLADSTFNSANSFVNMEQLVFNGFNVYVAAGAIVDFSDMARSGAGIIYGDTGNEVITGMTNADTIYGLDGDDTINGGDGNDTIYGDAGADTINGDAGNDNFYVSGTDALGDIYDGGVGTNYIRMQADTTFNSANSFTNLTAIINGGFDLILVSGTTIDFSGMNRSGGGRILGDAGAETITGFDNTNIFYGLGGADVMIGGSGNDDFYITGSEGEGDTFDGGSGGTTDEIRLLADSSFDSATTFISIERIVFGGFNVDIASGATVNLSGMTRSGAGQIHGAAGNETITGVETGTYIYGFAGDDTIRGGAGNDFIYGGDDDDVIYGGDGRDELYGEGGADIFVLENATAFNDVERIRDFSAAENDALDIQDLLSGYTFGTDDLTQFVQLVDIGGDANVYVDTAGTGTFGTGTQVATVYGITSGEDEVALEAAGYLITH